ncbi:MAG: DUF975 family protein [Clostridia bacterium]|nr:DUF975 family protein [Clostridia bacterium]
MTTHKEIFDETRKIFKKRKSKAVTISLVSTLVKVAVYFAIITAQFLCAQVWGTGFIYGAPGIIFYLLYIAAFVFVHIPINTGAGVCYAKIAMRHKVKVDEVFAYFKQMKKAIRCQLPVAIKVAAVVLALYFIGQILSGVLVIGGFAVGSAVWLFVMAVIALAMLACAAAIIISNSAITYILAKEPEVSPRKTVRMARNIMRYRSMDMFALYLRAIPRFLFGIITFGIGFIWTTPFINILNKRFIRYFCD